MRKILILTQKRTDAIWIVDDNMKNYLKQISTKKDNIEIVFQETLEKWSWFNVWINYFLSFFSSFYNIFRSDLVVISRPTPLILLIRFVFWFKKIVMIIHHIEWSWVNPVFTKILLFCSSFFVVPSEFTKNILIQRWWINKTKIKRIYRWISKNYYPEIVDNFLPYKYFLYVWWEYPRKNLKWLLGAFKLFSEKFPDIKLVKLWVSPNIKDTNNTDLLISKLGLQGKIILKREYLTEDLLRKYYSNSIAYILPSFLEWFWMTLPEAMACWTPVLCSNREPMTEIVWSTQNYFDPEDENSIFKKMEEIFVDMNLYKELSIISLEKSKKFDREITFNELYDFLKNI